MSDSVIQLLSDLVHKMNTFGNHLKLTTFGESHGKAIGGVLDGFPAGFAVDFEAIDAELARRAGRAENLSGTSQRAKHEADTVEWLSGIYEGKTLGTPIAFIVHNTDAHSADYDALQDVFRPAHADYTYQQKYGIRDPRGGGRASARETVARTVAGSLAKQWLAERGISIIAQCTVTEEEVRAAQAAGDSIGGLVVGSIKGLSAGIGEPTYDKLSARLAYAMLSINGCKGFDYGSGFEGVGKRGSELNDPIQIDNTGKVHFLSNHAGGILGGISTGQEITFRCIFKPTPSIAQPQQTITANKENTTLQIKGRHDACFALRTPPIVEAMAALAIMDFMV